MRHSICIPCALAVALLVSPARASEPSLADQLDEKIGEIDKQLEAAMGALEQFVDGLPMYYAPEFTPEGDIIIRKRRPGSEPEGSTDTDMAEERRI